MSHIPLELADACRAFFAGKVVALEGMIAAGKTKLSCALVDFFSAIGLEVVLHPEPARPELLKLYLSDRKKYAFAFQCFIFAMRMNCLNLAKIEAAKGKVVIVDRTMLGDRVFLEHVRANGWIDDAEYKAYCTLYHDLANVKVDLIVYLRINPETCWKRINSRGNPDEIKGYNPKEMAELCALYDRMASSKEFNWRNWVTSMIYLEWDDHRPDWVNCKPSQCLPDGMKEILWKIIRTDECQTTAGEQSPNAESLPSNTISHLEQVVIA